MGCNNGKAVARLPFSAHSKGDHAGLVAYKIVLKVCRVKILTMIVAWLAYLAIGLQVPLVCLNQVGKASSVQLDTDFVYGYGGKSVEAGSTEEWQSRSELNGCST